MYRESQQAIETTETENADADGDFMINNLVYEMPRSLSLRTARTWVSQFPQRATYKIDRNDTIIFDWNSGNSFIDAGNSFLKFKLKVYNATPLVTPATFGVYGSALNLFREIRIRSRSGTELSRCENSNLFNNYRLQYTKSDNWINTIGSTFYLNSTESPFNTGGTTVAEICIPLSEIDSMFRPNKSQLMPPQLASGLRLEFSMESLERAFKDPEVFLGATSYVEMHDISMMLDTVTMSDETTKLLNLESSQSGLEYVYDRVFSLNAIYPSGTSNATIQLQKAVSQSNHVFAILSNATNSNLGGVDSFISESYKLRSWQYRLGSSYYPQQQLIDSATNLNRGRSSYLMALSSFDKLKSPFKESGVTMNKFHNSLSIASMSLERDSNLQVSGLPINNSRVLELLLERDASSDNGIDKLEVNVFLTYTTVAKLFIDNVSTAI